jgi:hypothetical protein
LLVLLFALLLQHHSKSLTVLTALTIWLLVAVVVVVVERVRVVERVGLEQAHR